MAKISREEISNSTQSPSNETAYLTANAKPIYWPKVRRSS